MLNTLSTPKLSDTLTEVVLRAAQSDPDGPAMIFEDGLTVSRGELLERSERFAGYLAEHTEPGQMVAAMTANRAEFMVAWFAVTAVGCVFVALNPEAGEHDLTHVLRDSGAVLAIADATSAPRLQGLQAELPALRDVLVLADDEPRGLDAYVGSSPLSFAAIEVDPDAVTNVYYTSGTTGAPKGCMVTHRYWKRLVFSYLSERGLNPDDRILCCLKFFYNDPSWQLLSSLEAGVGLVIMRKFSVSRYWKVVADNDVTQVFTIGSIPALLLSADPHPAEREHKVRFGVQVAIDAERHAVMTERFGIPWVDSYGLTETGGLVGIPLADAEKMTGRGSMGKPRTDVEIKLVDEQGAPVPPDVPGELLVKAPHIMVGYLNRPDATAEAIDSDGWFHTGDLVRADADGWLFFSGRRKDIIRRAGENISAGEVEEVLRGHPAVIDAAAVPVDDELRGEEVLAHVYVGAADQAGLAEEIAAFCEGKLARHKVPRYLLLRSEDFPRTPSMRVAKKQLPRQTVPDGAWDREQAAAV